MFFFANFLFFRLKAVFSDLTNESGCQVDVLLRDFQKGCGYISRIRRKIPLTPPVTNDSYDLHTHLIYVIDTAFLVILQFRCVNYFQLTG